MHGAWGEGGALQAELERRGVPFVGSGSKAARLGMDKAAAKTAWRRAGLATPASRLVTRPGVRRADRPCVVKPVGGGSSIDCFVRPAGGDVGEAVDYLLARYGACLIEDFVDGHELTVGVLLGDALPPIWVDAAGTDAGWFDYKAKYSTTDGAAAHRFDLPAGADAGELQRLALAAHATVGCRDLSRVDLMLDRGGRPWLLEVNTMPGFTGRSLLPDAARRAGIEFADLCDLLVNAAANRAAPARSVA